MDTPITDLTKTCSAVMKGYELKSFSSCTSVTNLLASAGQKWNELSILRVWTGAQSSYLTSIFSCTYSLSSDDTSSFMAEMSTASN
jgi:hypothetical protein